MPDALRTAVPAGDWRSFKFTCEISLGMKGVKEAIAAGLAAGVSYLYLVNDTVGAVLESADFGEKAVLIYHAEKIMVPKHTESTDVFFPGDRVYWDPITRLVSPTKMLGDGRLWIGIATEPADVADLRVEIDLKGERTEFEFLQP